MNLQIIAIFQLILGIILIGLILLQVKGTGLGSAFGGDMGFYRTKRGVEKLLFYFTIIITFLFLTSALLGLVL